MELSVSWDEAGKRYALKLSKSGETVGSYLDQKDANDCLAGKKCVNLAVQVTQLIAELEDLITPEEAGLSRLGDLKIRSRLATPL